MTTNWRALRVGGKTCGFLWPSAVEFKWDGLGLSGGRVDAYAMACRGTSLVLDE